MLVELTIRNFAVIKDTRIEFRRGLNALTGETGAGKSIVLDALGAVLGERTSPTIVRAGKDRAYVEAIFLIEAPIARSNVTELLAELGVEYEEDEPVILSRDITPSRSTARINGRAVTARALTVVGQELVDIHGQSDHLSLLRPEAQLTMLDRFARTLDVRAAHSRVYRQWRSIRRNIEEFETERRTRAQRQDFLQLQLDEIESAAPEAGEDEALEGERRRLTHAVGLLSLANNARAVFEGSDELDGIGNGALDQLRSAEALLQDMSSLDPSTTSYLQQLRDALFALDELSSELREYLALLEVDPARLDIVNERLQAFRVLTRKYGGTIEEVLDHAASIREELDAIGNGSRDIDELVKEKQRIESELRQLALQLSAARSTAGDQLARRVESTIAELNMSSAKFAVSASPREDRSGLEIDGRTLAIDETGIDNVSFLLAANPGSVPQPLARVASGGETARLMLALKSILSEADETPTLIFDEIDVGIGGRSGQVVGEKLWNLANNHQVIVISHLPQVAAFAESHTSMEKRDSDGVVETVARYLVDDEHIDEIATMFDGKPVSPESRANALALLRRVEAWQATNSPAAGVHGNG